LLFSTLILGSVFKDYVVFYGDDSFSATFNMYTMLCSVGGAMGGALDLRINRSWVQFLLEAKLRHNLGQVVHNCVPLSPSSITWYQPRGGDALRL